MDLSWLLRWAPGLRQAEVERDNLREAYRQIEQEKYRLEDRLQALEQERTRLWDLFGESLRSERQAYQLHINMSMQRMGAGAPYPDAPHLTTQPQHASDATVADTIGRKGRVTTSELIEKQTRENLERMVGGMR